MGYRLGVDLGTTFTAAAIRDGGPPSMLGLGNRALQIPSVLYLQDNGQFLIGEAAERRTVTDPARVVREFKRRIGDPIPLMVAGTPFSAQALSARLLSSVVATATERCGAPPDEVVLTYPANWGAYKRELVDQIISLADVGPTVTCLEPQAAAIQYAARARLKPGERVVVYDLGGGTFDVCVLEKTADGLTILGKPEGIEQLGGVDFDEAVFQHVVGALGPVLEQLDLDNEEGRTALTRLRRDCVEAKEALSVDVDTVIPVTLPGRSVSVRLTRAELETLIAPVLEQTVEATSRALREAGTTSEQLTAIVLVGGSSRIPLVSHLLQSRFSTPTALDTHPKHDIALGAVQFTPSPMPAVTAPQLPTSDTVTAKQAAVSETRTAKQTAVSDTRTAPPAAPPPRPVADLTPKTAPKAAPKTTPKTAPETVRPKPIRAAVTTPPRPPIVKPPDSDRGQSPRTPKRRLSFRTRTRLVVGLVVLAVAAVFLSGAYALRDAGDDGRATGGSSSSSGSPSATPSTTPTPTPRRLTPYELVAKNKLYTVGALQPSRCPEPAYRPTSLAAVQAYYNQMLPCLNRTWSAALKKAGLPFRAPHVVVYANTFKTACGVATRGYYCGSDETIYLPFTAYYNNYKTSPMYIRGWMLGNLPRMYGYHVQYLAGILDATFDRQRATTDPNERLLESRKRELQVLCLSAAYLGADAQFIPLKGELLAGWKNIIAISGDETSSPKVRDHGAQANQTYWSNRGLTHPNPSFCNTFQSPPQYTY